MKWGFRKKKKRIKEKTISLEELDAQLISSITTLKDMLSQILITRKIHSGILEKTKHWKVSKNSESLFKLEGNSISLLISTGPFLSIKNKKLVGLLEMDEVTLCRLLANSKSKIKDFLLQADNEKLSYQSNTALNRYLEAIEKNKSFMRPLLQENSFFDLSPPAISLFISKVPMHLIAHSLIKFSDDYRIWLLGKLPYRYKIRLKDELDFISNYRSDISDAPFYKVYPLLSFEKAINEFWNKVEKSKII